MKDVFSSKREGARLYVLTGAALALLLGAMSAVWLLLGRQQADERWVRHTDEVLRHLDALLADVVDSETAERGFVISGEPSFLRPYEEARHRFARDLTELRTLTRDNPEQQLRLAGAERVARAELAAFGRVIELRRVDVPAAMAAVAGGGDKMFTDEVRRRLGELTREELRLLARRQAQAAATNQRTVSIVFGVHSFVLLALISAAWMVQRSAARRQLAERDAARLEATVQLARERRDRDDFREQFLGIVGHDLRTPLSAISIEAQLLGDLGDQRERKAAGQRILASTTRMTAMVDQLLDVTRSRLGGGMPISLRQTDLRALAQRVVAELSRVHPGRVQFTAEEAVDGQFDADRIAQVMTNLIGNALQHGEGTVEVTLTAGRDNVVFAVHNLGVPIPADELPNVFEAFRRGRGQPASLGLGLFITDQIVRGHSGHIEVSSSLEAGTRFVVVVPR